MQDIAPLIDDDIVAQYNEKYRRYKKVKKPNFVNGLTEVKINSAEDDVEYASRQGSREQSPERNSGLNLQSPDNNANLNTVNIGGNNNAFLVEQSIEPSNTSHSSKTSRTNNNILQPPNLDTRIVITPNSATTPNMSKASTPRGSGVIGRDANGNETLSA